MNTKPRFEKPLEKVHLKDQEGDGRIILSGIWGDRL
jgi:hypothetical protein